MVPFRIDLDGQGFAACAPYLTVERHRGLRLAVHPPVLITCPLCQELVQAAPRRPDAARGSERATRLSSESRGVY